MTAQSQISITEYISEETSRRIRNLGFLCSLFVVALHNSWPTNGAGLFFGRIFHLVLGPAAVPFFFAVSGFFLAGHFRDRCWWKQEIRKRIRSLVVPYFVWAILFLLFQASWDGFHAWSRGEPFNDTFFRGLYPSRWLSALGVDITRRPQLGVLWYMRCLMFFVVLSPWVFRGIQRIHPFGVILAFPVVCAYSTATKLHFPGSDPCGFFIYGVSLEGLWYFSLGSLLRIQPIKIASSLQGMAVLVAVLFLALHSLDLTSRWPVNSIVLSTPFVLLGLWICTPSTAWPSALVSCAFPIYLLHSFFNYAIAWMITRRGYSIPPFPGLSTVLVSASSILTALAIRRFTPRFGKIIFGGR